MVGVRVIFWDGFILFLLVFYVPHGMWSSHIQQSRVKYLLNN